MEANIGEVGPLPFGCAESTKGEKGGVTVDTIIWAVMWA